MQGLGNLLVVAVFVGPAAAARNLTDRMAPMIAAAAAIAVASVALAIVAAYLLSLLARPLRSPRARGAAPAGATIV